MNRQALSWRRTTAALALAVILMMARGAYASAAVVRRHAVLVSAEPAQGSRVDVSPARVRLVFSEPLEPTLAHVSLVGPDAAETQLAVTADPHDVNALVAPVPASLATGTYHLLWHIVSADGHPVEGGYLFGVGVAPDTTVMRAFGDPDEARAANDAAAAAWGPTLFDAPVLPALARGLAVGALMALGGVLLLLSWRRSAGERPSSRAQRLALWLAVLAPALLAVHLALWIVNATPDHRLSSDVAGPAFASATGRLESWRTTLALLALWALALARRPRIALAFAIAALAIGGRIGHPAAIAPDVTVIAKSAHLLGGAVWIGGMLWLLACDRDNVPAFAREASLVSSLALAGVVLVGLSGVVQALFFLATPLDLVRSAYGAVTLAKVAGLLALVTFGAHYRRRVLPRLSGDAARDVAIGFTRTLRHEVAVMAIVILLGGLLAYIPPRAEPATHGPMHHTHHAEPDVHGQ